MPEERKPQPAATEQIQIFSLSQNEAVKQNRQFIPSTDQKDQLSEDQFINIKIRLTKGQALILKLLACIAIIGFIYLFIVNILKEPVDFDTWSVFENEQNLLKSLKAYQKALIPGPNDLYVSKNGKKLPNSSKNPNRQPTNEQKLKSSQQFRDWDEAIYRKFLQKKVDSTSNYYESHPPKLTVFQVANQGKKNQLFIVGDSHSKFLLWRFQYLYEQIVKENRTDSFPTLVGLTREDTEYVTMNHQFVNFSQNFIKKHQPKRVLFSHRWLGYFKDCRGCPSEVKIFSPQHYELIRKYSQNYASMMKQLIDAGIEVYVAGIHIEGDQMNPKNMFESNQIIQKNIQPLKLSEFRQKHKKIIEIFEPQLLKVGVKLLRLQDHLCWQDLCHILTPSGHTFFIDDNHQGKVYNRYWASSVDFLVDF